MGLLDDAIREHLELKRRHGADPTEVERQEREALGPVQRQAAEPEDAPVAAPAPEAAQPLQEEAPPPDVAPALTPEPEPEEAGPPAAAEAPAGARRMPVEDDDVQWSDPAPIEPAADPAAEERDDEREDVLEETPEFLQETPEHDRLWFEQRPPRDFDF